MCLLDGVLEMHVCYFLDQIYIGQIKLWRHIFKTLPTKTVVSAHENLISNLLAQIPLVKYDPRESMWHPEHLQLK